MKKLLVAGAMMLAVIAAPLTAAYAVDTRLNITVTGLALRGYDPVAYFTDGRAMKGESKIAAVHDGAVYRFANEENKKEFLAQPETYLAAYGGYCAKAVDKGFKVDADPEYWAMVDGKVYLFSSERALSKWNEKPEVHIAAADPVWPTIVDIAPQDLK